jgi:hypothetical protein
LKALRFSDLNLPAVRAMRRFGRLQTNPKSWRTLAALAALAVFLSR